MANIAYTDVIRSISYDTSYILSSIIKLYLEGEDRIEVDVTYSLGGFYERSKEYPVLQPLKKFDVFPQKPDVEKLGKFEKWSLKSNSVKSILCDLPFIISKGPSLEKEQNADNKSNIIHQRYFSFYPKQEMFKTYYWFMMEAYRCLRPSGILIMKCQRTISGGVNIDMPCIVYAYGHKLGFRHLDRFTLLSKNRLHSGRIKTQIHSRSYESSFLVFRKPDGSAKDDPLDFWDFGTFPTRHRRR